MMDHFPRQAVLGDRCKARGIRGRMVLGWSHLMSSSPPALIYSHPREGPGLGRFSCSTAGKLRDLNMRVS